MFFECLKGLLFPEQGISCDVGEPVLLLLARSLIHFLLVCYRCG